MTERRIDDPDEAAIYWAARIMSQDMSAEEQAAYETWRSEPGNAEAEARLAGAVARIDSFATELLARSFEGELSDAAEACSPPEASRNPVVARRFPIAASIAVAAISVAVAVGFINRPSPTPVETFVTLRGEQQLAALADGTAVNLNSDTSLSVSYEATRRLARMTKGDAHFDVARDSARPFIVETPHATVSVTGTAFTVSVREAASSVYVTSGSVVARGDEAQVSLSPGEAVDIDAQGAPSPVEAFDEHMVLAWRDGVARFRDERLKEVVWVLNRYFDKAIAFDAVEIGDLRVTGEFDIQDQAAAIAAISLAFDLEADERGDSIVLRNTTE